MKMRRVFAALFALILSTCLLCACGKPQTAEKDDSPVAVQLGNRVITLAEVEKRYDYMLDMYANYGYAEPATSRAVEKLQDEVVLELVKDAMLLHQADLLGMGELDDEQTAEIRQNADEQLESLIAIYQTRAKNEGTSSTRRAAIRALEETITESGMGMSWDEYCRYLYDELYKDRVLSNLKAYVTADVAVTNEEIAAYYDEKLPEQQTAYDASPAECVDALTYCDKFGTKPVLYAPEGIVRIRILSVSGVSMKAQRTIEKAYSELQNGADFETVLLAYGQDVSYTKYPLFASEGVPFLPDGPDDAFDAKIGEAVGTLAVGAYSEPILLEDECVIVNVVSRVESGARALEPVRGAIEATLLADKTDAAWGEKKTEWYSDLSDVVYFEDVYRGVGK